MSLNLYNIPVKGTKNVRDLGGIPVSGGVVKKGKLIRSGNLSKINERGKEVLTEQCKVKTVIDLRNSFEKAEKPDVEINGVDFIECPCFDDSIPGISHETKADLSAVPDMTELYAAVVNGTSINNICDTVKKIMTLPEEKLAVLYHCTEGKDRTGMVTAIILTVLGADRKDILEDYLYTNKMNRKKAITYYILIKLFKMNKKAAKPVYGVFVARESYINEVFKFIDRVGMDKLLSDYIKITPAELEAFRNRVVE